MQKKKKKICETYGEVPMNDQTCEKFVKHRKCFSEKSNQWKVSGIN